MQRNSLRLHASKGAVLTDFRGLQRAGAVAVTDDGKPILIDTVMRDTMQWKWSSAMVQASGSTSSLPG
jgi:hypothetical protein